MGDYSNNLMGGGGGDLTSADRSTFKSANNLGKLPAGGSTFRGTSGLTQRAIGTSTRYSTKGLKGGSMPKIRPVKNEMKSIGRKRGF